VTAGRDTGNLGFERQHERLTVTAVRDLGRTLVLHLAHPPANGVGRHVEWITV